MNALTTSDAFKAMRTEHASRMTLPSQVFFTPTERFWECITPWITHHRIELVDCGCGMGILIEKAKQRKLKIRGVDYVKRPGQHKEVERTNVTDLSWSDTKWPLICRPSHDGWCEDVIRKAQDDGAMSIYVGLPKNYETDIGMFQTKKVFGSKPVGVEGEQLYLIAPLKKQFAQPKWKGWE